MKKLYTKDKALRFFALKLIKKQFVLKALVKQQNVFNLLKKKVCCHLMACSKIFSQVKIVNRCILTYNKKRFNKFTFFSRFLYLKLIRLGKINGFTKSSW